MDHPYSDFEGTDLWRVLDAEIAMLEGNRDVELTTARAYVIGYRCKRLIEERVAIARRSDVPAA